LFGEAMLSVLQASAWYPPASVGGTEVYLSGLVRELRAYGIFSRIVAPLGPQQADGYEFDDTTVRTYPVNAAPSRAELRGSTPHEGFSRFCEILREEKPDVYHQHSWSRGLGAAHFQFARDAGMKTVLTIHAPNNICLRGTMLRFGQSACDGHIDEVKCAECWSHGRGAPKPLARALAHVPSSLGLALRRAGLDGRAATAFSARDLVGERRAEFADMVANADRIVAVCRWLYDALARNDVPMEKLVLSRQGVDEKFAAAAEAVRERRNSGERRFRLLYIGRWHPVKGIDILVRAVRALRRNVPLELSIHGLGNGPEERAYEAAVRRLAEGDERIRIASPVGRDRLAETLSCGSALAVPSRCLETGPLVVLEAKAVGLPIIGSRLGGIAELVREPDDGLLVAPGEVKAWTHAILCMASKFPVSKSRQNASEVRTMHDAAADMAALYREICAGTLRSMECWCA
jgi:glycosyltransferase involved in cell wall biosynthesis